MRYRPKRLTALENDIVDTIHKLTAKRNVDNISRTDAYFSFYNRHPEIKWSFLAHIVSRNAGWNMCDLQGAPFVKLLKKKKRHQLFLTYEEANWLIFKDAYPQLLLYHYSTKLKMPLFHLLIHFHVSRFMVSEWQYFWDNKDTQR